MEFKERKKGITLRKQKKLDLRGPKNKSYIILMLMRNYYQN